MTKTLKELQEEHPEWCFKCGYPNRTRQRDWCRCCAEDYQHPILAALIAAKREDEARIADSVPRSRVNAIEAELADERRHKKEIQANAHGLIDHLQSQLTAEQQAHAETKRQLGEVDRALVEMAMNDDPSEETGRAYHRALARQACINRPTDETPTDDRGEGEK